MIDKWFTEPKLTTHTMTGQKSNDYWIQIANSMSLITTKVSEIFVYRDEVLIGHINRDHNNQWEAWFVMARNGPKTTYQLQPIRHTEKQEAIDDVVKSYEDQKHLKI